MDEQSAFRLEINVIGLIKKHKDGGVLTNIYDGGFGSSKSDDVRRKISDTVKEWHRNNVSPCTGRYVPQYQRDKISKALKGRKMSKEWIEKIRHTLLTTSPPLNKCHWLVISPEGYRNTVFGLRDFCEKHGLHKSHMIAVANGNRLQHKGWRCEHIN